MPINTYDPTDIPDFSGPCLALDTETTGYSPFHGNKPYAISGCDSTGQEFFWEWKVNPKTRMPACKISDIVVIKAVIQKYPQLVFHNAKFDILHLESIGISIPGSKIIHDTLLMSHVLDSGGSHALKDLSLRFLDILDDDEEALRSAVVSVHREAKKKGWNSSGLKEDAWMLKLLDSRNKLLEIYSRRDAERTIRLFLLFQELLTADQLLPQYERERQLQYVILKMEKAGVTIKTGALKSEHRRFALTSSLCEEATKIAAAKYDLPGINVRSSKQLQTLLFDKLKLPVLARTDKGVPSTSAKVLTDLLNHHKHRTGSHSDYILSNLLQQRKASKACEYLTQYEELAIRNGTSGYATLHPSINQTGTRTTRFSMQNPNAQNVSIQEDMPLRCVFGPPPGHVWLDFDYSNIEMRLFAYLAQEKELISAFEQGESVHMVICESLHGPNISKEDPRYKKTKNGNFAIIYGAGEARADLTYGVSGAFQKIRRRFPGLKRLTDLVMEQAVSQGSITTLFGYRLQCPEPHTALNYLIQGSAGDVIKYGMLNIALSIPANRAQLILTVHDELILQARKEHVTVGLMDKIAACMEAPGRMIDIPLPVSRSIVRSNWSEKENL